MIAFKPEFRHRQNQDGTYDSICRCCFATIATVRIENDLRRAEQEHTCNGGRLFWLRPGDDSVASK